MSATTSPSGKPAGRASIPASASGRRVGEEDRVYGRRPVSGGGGQVPPRGGGGSVPPRGSGGGSVPPRGPGYRPQTPYRGRPRPRWGRIALLAGLAVLIIAIIAGVSLYGYANGLDDDLKRTNAFSGLTGDRPAKPVDGALNLLLVGSDSRDPDASKEDANSWRADTLILMHIPEDHKSAQLISIPRDLWVVVPKTNGAECGDGQRAKINASFAFGGLPRAVHTVECLTDVKIDHVMAIDFGGFKEVTDALGGVDLKVDKTIKSIHKPYRVFKKGMMHMNGAQALDWVRQRYQFPRGDFDRVRHQQEFLKALMDKAVSTGTIANPAKLDAFLKAVTAAVTVDQEFSLTDLAVELRDVRGENLTFLTSPNQGSQTVSGQSVVVSDREKAISLYRAVAEDKMAEWMSANPDK
jgi:LCP family protein required for cell wall assembly